MKSSDIYLIYIGYLIGYHFNDPILLCVSENKNKIKYYLKNVRNLSKDEYEIREVVLDYDTALNMYEDYFLIEYSEDCLFLTNRDVIYINKEIESTIDQLEKSYKEYKNYCNIIKKVPKLNNNMDTLLQSLYLMQNQLSKVKNLRKICNSELKNSPIFSKNILTYLKSMEYLQEDRELTELFYRKVYGD